MTIPAFKSDIDIDFGDRTKVLDILKHTPASIMRDNKLVKHNTGVYFQKVPVDPFNGLCSIEHKESEDRGYIKLDLLNVNLYNQVESKEHLNTLLHTEPAWDRLYDESFCAQLIHIGDHYNTLIKMPEAVTSIARLAMFLAVIRPAKRHLIGKPWKEVAETIWEKPADGSYYFKKSHSVAYERRLVRLDDKSFNEQLGPNRISTSLEFIVEIHDLKYTQSFLRNTLIGIRRLLSHHQISARSRKCIRSSIDFNLP
jgi:hypothetical protein